MGFIFLFLLPVIVSAKSNDTLCFKNLIVMDNIGTELSFLYLTAASNILLLVLNITILYAVLGYMKPTISDIRKQTFIIMDYILYTYIPCDVRQSLGCRPEILLSDDKNTKDVSKVKSNSKSTTNTSKQA